MNGKSLLNATHHRAVEVLKEIENEADFVITRLVDPVNPVNPMNPMKDQTLTRPNSNAINNKVVDGNKSLQEGNANLKGHSPERSVNVGFEDF